MAKISPEEKSFNSLRELILYRLNKNDDEHDEIKSLVQGISDKLDPFIQDLTILKTEAKVAGRMAGLWVSLVIGVVLAIVSWALNNRSVMAAQKEAAELKIQVLELNERIKNAPTRGGTPVPAKPFDPAALRDEKHK